MLRSRFARAGAWTLAGALASGTSARADSGSPAVEDSVPATPREPTGTFQIGGGISPDDGFIATARIEQPDLFRTGQRLALSADVTAIRQKLALHYDIPSSLPNTDLRTEIFAARRDFGAFTREGAGGQFELAHKLTSHTQIYGRYRFEAVRTELDAMAQKPAELAGMSDAKLGNGNIATLGAGIVHDTLDERYLPRRGTRFELFTERAARRWGSDYNFERTGGALDLARDLGGGLTLRLHGHAAYIRSNDPMGVPLSERLQHDGHAEVRGYALDALPPLGSNFEAIGRAELELSIWKKAGLSIAGWGDIGMRRNSDAMYGTTDGSLIQRSLGGSLIWRTPIGPLRFDVAFPLDGPGVDRDRQYLFGLGGWWW